MIKLSVCPGKQSEPDCSLRSTRSLIVLLGTALILSMVTAVCFGAVTISPLYSFQIILYKLSSLDLGQITTVLPATYFDIVWDLRLPRILLAAIAGAGLSVCGAVMQASVQNPLADPYILGVSAGASLGATFAILLGGTSLFGSFGIIACAFIGALAAAALVMSLSTLGGSSSTVKIVLSGTIANAFFLSLANFIIYFSNNTQGISNVTFWNMGSLAAASWQTLLLPAITVLLGSLYLLSQSRTLNTLMLGEETALTLGVNAPRVRYRYMLLTALLTAVIVSSCGTFAFVGLIIPHIVRGFVGADHRRLIPGTVLGGAVFLIWADTLSRTILSNGELPIGIITSLIGAPFFMYILIKRTFS